MALNNIMNLSDFQAVISDISRPYLFLVSIPFIDSDDTITWFARSTTLPEYKISKVEVAFQTQKLQIASTAEFSHEWEVEFLVDSGHAIRNKFIGWMSLAYDPSIQRNGAPVEYKTDNVQVQQLDRTSNTVVSYGFVGLFPESVGQITVSHEEDKPETFPVNFSFDYWVMGGAGGVNIDIGAFFVGIDLSTGSAGGSLTIGAGIGGVAGTLGISF